MENGNSRRMEERVLIHQNASADEILTPAKAGALFGVSEWAMYKRAKKGQAPGHYMGRKLYFLKSELVSQISEL